MVFGIRLDRGGRLSIDEMVNDDDVFECFWPLEIHFQLVELDRFLYNSWSVLFSVPT